MIFFLIVNFLLSTFLFQRVYLLFVQDPTLGRDVAWKKYSKLILMNFLFSAFGGIVLVQMSVHFGSDTITVLCFVLLLSTMALVGSLIFSGFFKVLLGKIVTK